MNTNQKAVRPSFSLVESPLIFAHVLSIQPRDHTESVAHWKANFLESFSTDMQSGDRVIGFGTVIDFKDPGWEIRNHAHGASLAQKLAG